MTYASEKPESMMDAAQVIISAHNPRSVVQIHPRNQKILPVASCRLNKPRRCGVVRTRSEPQGQRNESKETCYTKVAFDRPAKLGRQSSPPGKARSQMT
jgi:hypothetical protein